MYMGAYFPTLSPEGCRGKDGVLGQPGQFCFMFASSSCQHDSRQLLFLFNNCMFCYQVSSYSNVLLAVAETQAPAPMRHQPEDKRP
jgi:hypothetical protein